MRALAIDTSGPAAGVAAIEDGTIRVEIGAGSQSHHLERLMPLVERTMMRAGWVPADVNALLVTRGPGSFTGLRIGMATARGMAAARSIPVVGVPTMEAWARTEGRLRGDTVPRAVMVDARRGNVYLQVWAVDRAVGRMTPTDRTREIAIVDLDRALPAAAVIVGSVPPGMAEIRPFGLSHGLSCVAGVALAGWERLERGETLGPYDGPEYVRGADVGLPKRYDR